MANVTFTPNGVKTSNAANTVKILSPDTVKQGDTENDFRVQLLKGDVPVDLTGKTVTWSAASNKGKFVSDRPATVEGDGLDGTVGIEFTGDDQGATGSMRVEFKVAYADGDVEKFPAQSYAYFEITRSLDDLATTPVMFASVQYFESKVAEVKTGQEAFEQTVDGKIVELETTVAEGIGAFTEDTEVINARGGAVNLGARLDDTTAQLAETAKQADLEIERARISNLTANAGNTDGNAELLDMRVGFDGVTYATAGEATRALGSYMTEENQSWEVI